jgi:Repeat of unknown function (DUF5650)/FG-GAP-like repeat/FG-GAP repeat
MTFTAASTLKKILPALLALLILGTSMLAVSPNTNLPSPAGGGSFGTRVTLLPNGNFVVTDPFYSSAALEKVGAVYLYDPTGTLVSRMVGVLAFDEAGSGGVAVLSNGDFVVSTPTWQKFIQQGNQTLTLVGAVTKCSGKTGCPTNISAENSLTGDKGNDLVGGGGLNDAIIPLSNGNYVVRSFYWSLSAAVTHVGAVTFCDGAANGCANKIVSGNNSLIGSTSDDYVGGNLNDVGINITILSGGDYVVSSPQWNRGGSAPSAGAVTQCSGTTGCVGAVSTANSLTGAISGNAVGGNNLQDYGGGVFPLPNNMYIVADPFWSASADLGTNGSVTLCNGSSNSCGGQTVSQANSLTGGSNDDRIGAHIDILANGDYVATSSNWDKPAPDGASNSGAVTLCRVGTNSCAGQIVSTSNSLTGGAQTSNVGSGNVTVLSNGNYVVSSPTWMVPTFPTFRAGAATYCDAVSNNCAGRVPSSANSLVGGGAMTPDLVSGGLDGIRNGVTALVNGDYVVSSPNWSAGTDVTQQYLGAVTLCRSAAGGCTGTVSAANSLTGAMTTDHVGFDGVTALNDGSFVVNTSSWHSFGVPLRSAYGAVTYCSGSAIECTGHTVTAVNSLTGTKEGDLVGISSLALTNGNFVVLSPLWDLSSNVADVGAVTFCSVQSGNCSGQQVTSSNSLVGSTADDRIGDTDNEFVTKVRALDNGNYAVTSPDWDGAAPNSGAFTLGNGFVGTVGQVSGANSAIGTAHDGGNNIYTKTDQSGYRIFVGFPNDSKVAFNLFPKHSPYDYDGDVMADVSVYRESAGDWFFHYSAGGTYGREFGSPGDRFAPADYDGDGKTDIAVFRPSSGIWYIVNSSTQEVTYQGPFGLGEDLPVVADYDGDGKADIAVFRPSTATFYRRHSGDGSFHARQFGAAGDKPIVGDFDGDFRSDIAIFRPSLGSWYVLYSSDGSLHGEQFGYATDVPVPADYDGDSRTDLAVFRGAEGLWFVRESGGSVFTAFQWGLGTDVPAPGDFDGDGKADYSVYRPSTGYWFHRNSSDGSVALPFPFGAPDDRPTMTAFRF